MARRKTATERRMEARPGGVEDADITAEALRLVLRALVPIDFNRRRDVLRWAHEHYSIDPTVNRVTHADGK